MPSTDIQNSERPPRKPNWVEVGTLVLLALNLIAVGVYAYEAYKQNALTGQAIEVQSRPYLACGFSPDRLQTGNGGVAISWPLNMTNSGKLPGNGYIKAAVAYSTTDLTAGPSLDASCVHEQHIVVWPGGTDTSTIAHSCEGFTAGQLSDFRAGAGWVFTAADVKYGQGHHTHVCYKFKAASDQTAIPPNGLVPPTNLRAPELCTDPTSNYTD
jgi:hypothetical protein